MRDSKGCSILRLASFFIKRVSRLSQLRFEIDKNSTNIFVFYSSCGILKVLAGPIWRHSTCSFATPKWHNDLKVLKFHNVIMTILKICFEYRLSRKCVCLYGTKFFFATNWTLMSLAPNICSSSKWMETLKNDEVIIIVHSENIFTHSHNRFFKQKGQLKLNGTENWSFQINIQNRKKL